ncbi:uncharacterized protein LOC141915552 [Tubulanus polymorphus]|uniref:uncharacterized protein LOC141915552 n=1 Tax=Tubulanus polymorphus TaxID=672921 RepID=UPI003DA53AE6
MSQQWLSVFQQEKLQCLFGLIGGLKDTAVSSDSMIRNGHFKVLQERILNYTKWEPSSKLAMHTECVLDCFREASIERIGKMFETMEERQNFIKKGEVTWGNWSILWCPLLDGAKNMSDFPMWVQALPKVLFDLIDLDCDGEISYDELLAFHRDLIGVDNNDLGSMCEKAYDVITDRGRYPLDATTFEQLFANFLIGRSEHGPGKFIFGMFEHRAHLKDFTTEDQTKRENNPVVHRRRSSVTTARSCCPHPRLVYNQ